MAKAGAVSGACTNMTACSKPLSLPGATPAHPPMEWHHDHATTTAACAYAKGDAVLKGCLEGTHDKANSMNVWGHTHTPAPLPI
eukprot:2915001-Amphidinium_carterae.1